MVGRCHRTIEIVLVFIFVLAGCTRTGTLPDEAKALVSAQIADVAGCNAAKGEDCKETTIRRAYDIQPNTLPMAYQHATAAWCVQWEVLIHHPINGNYYAMDDWVVVLREASTYTLIEAARGYVDEMNVCAK